MARIIHDDQGGSSSSEGHLTVIQADGQSQIALPDSDFMSKGEIIRDGQDLHLQSSDGSEVVIEGYFSAMPAPLLTTPQGSMMTPELVQSFVKSAGPVEYAANGTENDVSAVGIIKEVSGDATVTRTDGTSEKATLGMAVHQGDIVETSAQGAVNIVFLDESSFSISNDARLAIDEYVFDPATQAGETNVSILRGMFVFTSGLIGRDDPDDVSIDTPVGSIGIRGTTIAGRIDPNGESQITVVEGAIVIKNGVTEVTLAEQYQTVKLTGFDQQIQMAGTLDSGAMKASYGMLGTVNAGFFNTLNTSTDSEGRDDAAPSDAAPQDAPAADPSTEGSIEAEQPVVASYDIFSDPLNSGFDLSVLPASDNPYDTDKNVTASLIGTAGTAMFLSDSAAAPAMVMADVTVAVEGPAAPALLPLEVVVEIFVDDDAMAGDVVGRVFTTINFPAVDIQFTNVPLEGGDPVFRLVQVAPGVYNVVLTAAGDAALANIAGSTVTSLGNVEVAATLPDGRTTNTTTASNYGEYSGTPTGPTAAATLLLDSMTASDGTSTAGTPGQGLGFSAAYTGDNNFLVFGNGRNVAGNGDINGDGFMDYMSGEPDNGVYPDGVTYIYSGNGGPPAASIATPTSGDDLGYSVAMTDFNGDGYADIFSAAIGVGGGEGQVSAFFGYAGYSFTGGTFTPLITGQAGGNLDLLGIAMTSLRDFNGDGYGDIAVSGLSAANTSFVKIYTGNATGIANTPTILNGFNTITGYDVTLTDLGDSNGDGSSDLVIYASGGMGSANIVFGGTGGVGTVITGTDQMIGAGSAGDFNGDGFDDIFVATRTGQTIDAFVIYGSNTLAAAIALDATWLANNQGSYYHMTIDLNNHGIPATITMSSIGVGDQNNDGFEDLMITSPDLNYARGGYYIVNGRADPFDLAGPDPEIHTDAGTGANAGVDMITSTSGDGLVGSGANNIMANLNAGNVHSYVSFQAGGGEDIINLHGVGTTLARVIDGGDGYDELRLMTDGMINLNNISHLTAVEEIAFGSANGQTLALGLNDVFSLMQTSISNLDVGLGLGTRQTLMITNDGGPGTKVLAIDDPENTNSMGGINFNLDASLYNDGTSNYSVYTFGSGYQLLVEQGVTITVN